jgi:hypothetical protein
MGAYRPEMRVLAASFSDDARAQAARAQLLVELALGPQQIGVESLADPGDGRAATAVLAGRFDDELIDLARRLIEQLGGTVMLDIDARESNA